MQVSKYRLNGEKVVSYPVKLLHEDAQCRLVEGHFALPDRMVEQICLCEGDLMLEAFFSRRWYTIMEIYDQDSSTLKGWYCDVCQSAKFSADAITWVDLALDLLVYPDGSRSLLDQNEFARLPLDADSRAACWQAVRQLLRFFDSQELKPMLAGFHK